MRARVGSYIVEYPAKISGKVIENVGLIGKIDLPAVRFKVINGIAVIPDSIPRRVKTGVRKLVRES